MMRDYWRVFTREQLDNYPRGKANVGTTSEVDYDVMREHFTRLSEKQIALSRDLSIGGNRWEDRTIEGFRRDDMNGPAFDAARRVALDSGKSGLWAWGTNGNGKTHLAAAIVNAARGLGYPAIFTSVENILERVRSSFDSEGDKQEANAKALFVHVPVLALDDLGKERLTAWGGATLFEIVNTRYELGLPVVVTSNLEPLELAKHYVKAIEGDAYLGTGLVDRLKQMAGTVVEVRGKSQRSRQVRQVQGVA